MESGDTGAVHRARVASRRLRELLPVLQIEPAAAHKLGRRLRKLAGRLGGVREVDVLTELVGELRQSSRVPARALKRLTDELGAAREHEKRGRSRKGLSADLRRVLRRLEAVASELEGADRGRARGRGWRWAIEARVAHRASALKSAARDAGAMFVPERLHQVRLAIKKLRYGVELSAESIGLKNTADLRLLRREQELLGRLRDLQVLVERVRRVQVGLTPPDLAAWRELDAVVIALDGQCRRLHARYVKDRVALNSLCDRLGVRASSAAARRAG
ncbi:MAG: hypothetical protein A3H97_00865 [Acidobacteria bacterium RIFCSPLOWO2_02_FULL_65_29]|nr:MAG: hypothetical protein A3H97_00865 [Acidobacteria bacterium RIFCSPLOWO2_02_FULL_65_29]